MWRDLLRSTLESGTELWLVIQMITFASSFTFPYTLFCASYQFNHLDLEKTKVELRELQLREKELQVPNTYIALTRLMHYDQNAGAVATTSSLDCTARGLSRASSDEQ